MLGFFRKYQKFFFVIVTFFVVISFSFFGTSNTFLDRSEKVPDREIGQLVDGTTLKERRLNGLIHLLQHGMEEGGSQINLLNDSLVHREFMMSGLAEILALHHYDKLAFELEAKWKRAKSFSPYVHPHASQISARAVWEQFCPKILSLLEELKAAPEEFSKEQLPLLFKFYQAQSEFPAHYLHRVLYYQQAQDDQIRQDVGLPNANLALFGFQNIEDWFGLGFLEEVGRFILNTSCVAREEGYQVKKQEAKIDLFSNVFRGLKAFSRGENPSTEEAANHYSRQISSVGLEEGQAVDLWNEVMLFRRLFHEVAESVFLDQLSFSQFKDFAKPSHEICRYTLPRSLHLQSFRDMLKFQRYLEIVADQEKTGPLDLPVHLRHAESIMDAYPELVYKSFDVEMASITKIDAAARVSLKQTWQWEAEEKSFAMLQAQFPSLAKHTPQSDEERLQALDGLDELARFKVDQYARSVYIDEHPEVIDELLAQKPKTPQTLKVSLKGDDYPFSGQHFLGLLEVQDRALDRYTFDEETFYSIDVLSKGKGWHIFSFEEMSKTKILNGLLDELLMAAYSEMNIEESFEEVKDDLGEKLYRDLLNAIAKGAKIKSREDYHMHRFDTYLVNMHTLAQKNPEEFVLAQNGPWKLEEKIDQIAPAGIKKVSVGEFSNIEEGSFYQLTGEKEIEATEAEAALAKSYLKKEAQQELMRKLLKRI